MGLPNALQNLLGALWTRIFFLAGVIALIAALAIANVNSAFAAAAILIAAIVAVALISRRLSNALIESEALGQAVLTTVVDGIITIDPKGIVLSYNPACERIFQYSSAEVVGQNVKMLMPETYSAAHDGYLAHYAGTGEKKIIGIGREVEGRRKDGSLFPLDLAVSEVRLASGSIFTGIVRDISERKAAELALKESEARVQTVLDTVVDGVISIDEFGIVQSYNKACVGIFGYRPEEVVGQNIKLLMPPNFAAGHDGYLAHYMATGERKIIGIGREVEGQRKDGTRFPLDLAVSQVEINRRRVFTGLVRDISERRAHEEALKASEERYDMVIRAMSAGYWAWDMPSGDLFWSDRTWEITGLPRKAVPEIADFDACRHPDDAPEVAEKFNSFMNGGGNFEAEYRFIRPEGKIIWLSVTATCSYDGEGNVVRIVGSMSDVSARKEAEAEREQLIAALAQSNRELDEFAYVASHDLKAPLRVIDNASTWLEEDLADRLDEESRENLELLRNRVRRMDRLLDDLLEYSRVGRKTDNQWLETVSGQQLQDEIRALVPVREGFEIVFEPSFLEIGVTLMPIKQILINLVGNALKHHDRESGTVVVRAVSRGSKYLISVIDDGPGIPDQFRDQIFKMFQTLKPRDRVEGSGMGLAIVRKHVDVLGERVWVERGGTRGSIFSFTYPKSTEVQHSFEG